MNTPQPKRRWLQYSLRSLLVLTLLASIGMSWVAVQMREAKRNREIAAEIQRAGGLVFGGVPPWARWSSHIFNEHPLKRVDGVTFCDDGTESYRHGPPHVGIVDSSRMSNIAVTDALLEQIGQLSQLRFLGLGQTQFTDAGLKHLAGLGQLHSLCLYRTSVTDAGVAHLKRLSQLRQLYLDSTGITDAGLRCLENASNLQELYVGNTLITDAGLEHLKGLQQLLVLSISGSSITDVGLEHLKGLTNLQRLDHAGTRVTPEGLKTLQRALPKCKIRLPFEYLKR